MARGCGREVLQRAQIKTPGKSGGLLQERAMGFEPTTSALGRLHSTTELRPQITAENTAVYEHVSIGGFGVNFRAFYDFSTKSGLTAKV